tara:strand:- start:459 stop:791 length:333 start_codon:yes stop_codon:yes gene_type:complete
MTTIKVGDMKNVPWKKTKATLSIMVQTNVGTFIIKDCRLIDGINGLYIAGPSRKYENQDGEDVYFQYLDLDKDAQHAVIQKAQEAYDSSKEDYKMYDPFPRAKREEEIPF